MAVFTSQRKWVIYFTAAFCVLSLLILSIIFGVDPAHAQLDGAAYTELGNSTILPQTNIIIMIAKIIRIFLGILGIILTILLMYAGWLYMTSQGQATQVEKAKNIIKQAVIGLVIILTSYAIASFILNVLLGNNAPPLVVDPPAPPTATDPLSGSLGAGIVQDHYPMRNATDIARNTQIFVTFKEPMDASTIIRDADANTLNADNVKIFETADGAPTALLDADVFTAADETNTTFVFKPNEYLGNAIENTNYTVQLGPGIKLEDGSAAFTGNNSSGYAWTFTVSTEIDLTPPRIISVIPQQDAIEPRNITVEVTFNEAVSPLAATGSYITVDDPLTDVDETTLPLFTNIEVLDELGANVEGRYEISNAYRTIGFTTTDACGEDPCGDTIYCLPGDEDIDVEIHAASIGLTDQPQTSILVPPYDGVIDAAGNSLDGDDNFERDPEGEIVAGTICGSNGDGVCGAGVNDDYTWSFSTTDEIEDTVPHITGLSPDILTGNISITEPLGLDFNSLLKSSTVTSKNGLLIPQPYYQLWYTVSNTAIPLEAPTHSRVFVGHQTFVSDELGGHNYWPVMTEGIKSAYQICMYPSHDDDACSGNTETNPYCCNGAPQVGECISEDPIE